MEESPGGGTLQLSGQIDRLRRTNMALRHTSWATAPDALSALTACIRTEDRPAASRLAQDWFSAAERAVGGDPAAPRDRAALTLLARVLGVPAAYFTNVGTSREVDAHLKLASEAARLGIAYYGPCRGAVPDTGVRTIHALLLRELERRHRRNPQ